jgi:hypothetical protein
MYGNIIVRGIGRSTPAVAPGFVLSQVIDQNLTSKVLYVEVPQTGAGLDTPNFSLIAQGNFAGQGTWTFGLYLTQVQPNPFVGPTNSPIAQAVAVIGDALQHSYVFEADISVVAGVLQASSPWTLTIDGVQVASGTCSNFPSYKYPVGPSDGQFTTTNVCIRTLAFSFSAVSTAVSGAAIATLNIAEAGYGANMPVSTVNAFNGS